MTREEKMTKVLLEMARHNRRIRDDKTYKPSRRHAAAGAVDAILDVLGMLENDERVEYFAKMYHVDLT